MKKYFANPNKTIIRMTLTAIIAMFCFIGYAEAQDCYNKNRSNGVTAMRSQDYDKAIRWFEVAQKCPDKPENNDLQSKINECRNLKQQMILAAEEQKKRYEKEERDRKEAVKREKEEKERERKEMARRKQEEAMRHLSEGLVAYYPFDGNANDMSGNGHHGTVNGNVTLTTGRKNDPNGAYLFPGRAMNYISIPHRPDLNMNTFTINAWVFSDRNGYESGYIVDKGRDITVGTYRLSVNGVGACTKYNGSNGAGVQSVPSVGYWHMVTGTVSGQTARFYVDGALVDEKTLTTDFRCNTSDPLIIGMHYYPGCPAQWAYPYYGKIDDVSIYNRVLSSEEISTLYNSQSIDDNLTSNATAKTVLNVPASNSPTNISSGLVAYYPFDGNANDFSGNNNNGIIEGATFTGGRTGQCAHFGGYNNSQIIRIPNSNSLRFTNAASFSFWFKLDSSVGMDGWGRKMDNGRMVLFAKNFDRGQVGAGINMINSNSFRIDVFNDRDGCDATINGNPINTWYHAVIVVTDNYYKIYINGNEVAVKYKTMSFNASNSCDLILGRLAQQWYPLHGCLDEFRVYNRLLSDEEIRMLSNGY